METKQRGDENSGNAELFWNSTKDKNRNISLIYKNRNQISIMTRLRRLSLSIGTPPFAMARPQLSINETQY